MEDKQTIKSFTDLKVWREGHQLVLKTYKAVKKFPKFEIYTLGDQMRRSAISVTSNVAEGFGRHSYKEKLQFYYLAQGSLTELKNQLIIAKDVEYITLESFDEITFCANETHKLLQGLIKKTKSFL